MASGSRLNVWGMPRVDIDSFVMFSLVFQHTTGKDGCAADSSLFRVTVRHDTRQVDHIGDPTAIVLSLYLYAIKRIRWLVSEASSLHPYRV